MEKGIAVVDRAHAIPQSNAGTELSGDIGARDPDNTNGVELGRKRA